MNHIKKEKDKMEFNGYNIITESILDPTHKILSKDVWDSKNDSYILKSEIKNYIANTLKQYLESNNINTEDVKNLYVVGSITGFKYNEKSDVDVNVGLQTSEENMEILKKHLNDVNGKPIPNTTHPLNFYFLPFDTELKTGDFTYDILDDNWIESPKVIKEDIDYISVTTLAISECRAVDGDEDELRRDLIDYFLLKHDLEEIYELVLPKNENEIFADLDNLKKRLIQIHNYRNLAFSGDEKEKYLTTVTSDVEDNNYTINNIVYKHLERYGYLDRLKQYNKIHKMLIESNKSITDEIEKGFKDILGI